MIRPVLNTQIIPRYNATNKTNNSRKNQIVSSNNKNIATISFRSNYVKDSNRNYEQIDKTINLNNTAQKQKRKLEYTDALIKIKNEQIKPQLLDLIIRESKGKLTEMPNCVMLSCGSEYVNNDLVEWTKANADCRVVTMDANDSLHDVLENAEDNYQKEHEWTLLHIKNFSNYINPKISTFETIEAAKAIMSETAEDHHTTILFTAEHPEELNDIALESHRVRHITGNIKTAVEVTREDAWERLLKKPCIYNTESMPLSQHDKEILYYQSLSDKTTFYTEGKNIFQSAIKDLIIASGFEGTEMVIKHSLPTFIKEPPYVIPTPDTKYILSTDNCTIKSLKDIEQILDNMLATQFKNRNYTYKLNQDSNKKEHLPGFNEYRFIKNPYYNLPGTSFLPNEEYIGARMVQHSNAHKDTYFLGFTTASKEDLDLGNPDTTTYNEVNNSRNFKGNLQLAILGGFLLNQITQYVPDQTWIKILNSISLDPEIDVDTIHNYLLNKFSFSADSFARFRLNVPTNYYGVISDSFIAKKDENKKVMTAVIQQIKDYKLIGKCITAMKNIGYIKPLDYLHLPNIH